MTIVGDFQNGVTEALGYGQEITIRRYNTVFGNGSYYDDDITLTLAGTAYVSGVFLPIDNTRGSSDAIALEEGKVLTNDTKLYIDGSVNTSGTIKISTGSPPTDGYSLLSEGTKKWDVNATSVLKKLYIRRLPSGSLTGEVN